MMPVVTELTLNQGLYCGMVCLGDDVCQFEANYDCSDITVFKTVEEQDFAYYPTNFAEHEAEVFAAITDAIQTRYPYAF